MNLHPIADRAVRGIVATVLTFFIMGCAQFDAIEGIRWLSDRTDWEETYNDVYQSSRYHEYRDRGFSKKDARYGAMMDRFNKTGDVEF